MVSSHTATAFVKKQRLENDTTNGAPGRSTRRTSRNSSERVRHVLDRDRARGAVERLVVERQAWLAVHVVHDVTGELRVVGHLLGVHPEPHDLARVEALRQMAAPAAHQIEQPAAGRQHRRVEPAERGDGAVVDVDDLAGREVETVVGRLVVARVRRGRQHAVAWVAGHLPILRRPYEPAGRNRTLKRRPAGVAPCMRSERSGDPGCA